jgi:hypothetical protein
MSAPWLPARGSRSRPVNSRRSGRGRRVRGIDPSARGSRRPVPRGLGRRSRSRARRTCRRWIAAGGSLGDRWNSGVLASGGTSGTRVGCSYTVTAQPVPTRNRADGAPGGEDERPVTRRRVAGGDPTTAERESLTAGRCRCRIPATAPLVFAEDSAMRVQTVLSLVAVTILAGETARIQGAPAPLRFAVTFLRNEARRR